MDSNDLVIPAGALEGRNRGILINIYFKSIHHEIKRERTLLSINLALKIFRF